MTRQESQAKTHSATTDVESKLREYIVSGRYKAGDWFPTERRLAEELGVDRRVVRTAVNHLVQSGLAIRRPHCRPIVGAVDTAPTMPAALAASSISSNFMALLMCHGNELIERAFSSQQRIFWGMNQALAQAGRHAVFLDLSVVASEAENALREADHLRYLLQQGFGGAVFYPYAYRSNHALVKEVATKIPLVSIDRQIDFIDTDFVGVDNFHAMYEAVMHLVSQGHRRIAYITKNEAIRPVQERIQGYIAAVREAGIAEIVLSVPSDAGEQNWTSVEAVFQLPEKKRPTAAACFNDYNASDLVHRLEAIGLSVPDDVAVTGFDDIVPLLPNGVGLTTIAQPYEEIGRRAAELLLLRLNGQAGPSQVVELPAQIVVRESSARLR